jgi:hypothetical protein
MLVAILTSCCAKDTGSKTEDRSPARPALSAEDSPGKASAKDASSHQREKKIVSARAFPANKGDGKDAKPIEITLRLEGEEQVSGELRLPGNPMELFGFRREGHIRLWALGKSDKAEDVQRGYLFGTIEGEQAKGSFAVSGNGGEPVLQGTWSSLN